MTDSAAVPLLTRLEIKDALKAGAAVRFSSRLASARKVEPAVRRGWRDGVLWPVRAQRGTGGAPCCCREGPSGTLVHVVTSHLVDVLSEDAAEGVAYSTVFLAPARDSGPQVMSQITPASVGMNTLDAHGVIWFAGREGKQDAVVERLFSAFFHKSRDVGCSTVLVELANSGARLALRCADADGSAQAAAPRDRRRRPPRDGAGRNLAGRCCRGAGFDRRGSEEPGQAVGPDQRQPRCIRTRARRSADAALPRLPDRSSKPRRSAAGRLHDYAGSALGARPRGVSTTLSGSA